MASFDTGVTSYIHATATVHVYFPVNERGNADISCRQCYYFRESQRRCALNWEVCEYPDRFVGSECPLKPDTDETGEIQTTTT